MPQTTRIEHKPRLAREKFRVDERYNTALRDDHIAEELVQPTHFNIKRVHAAMTEDSLFIVSYRKLQVTGNNTLFLDEL